MSIFFAGFGSSPLPRLRPNQRQSQRLRRRQLWSLPWNYRRPTKRGQPHREGVPALRGRWWVDGIRCHSLAMRSRSAFWDGLWLATQLNSGSCMKIYRFFSRLKAAWIYSVLAQIDDSYDSLIDVVAQFSAQRWIPWNWCSMISITQNGCESIFPETTSAIWQVLTWPQKVAASPPVMGLSVFAMALCVNGCWQQQEAKSPMPWTRRSIVCWLHLSSRRESSRLTMTYCSHDNRPTWCRSNVLGQCN